MRGDGGSERVPLALFGDAPRIRMDGTVVLPLCSSGVLGIINGGGLGVAAEPETCS